MQIYMTDNSLSPSAGGQGDDENDMQDDLNDDGNGTGHSTCEGTTLSVSQVNITAVESQVSMTVRRLPTSIHATLNLERL